MKTKTADGNKQTVFETFRRKKRLTKMKLTNKFWIWLGQVFAANVLLWRIDLLRQIFGLIPNVDLSQFYFESGVVKLGAFFWILWLGWRGYEGFCRKMDFVIDENNRR